MPTRDAYDDMTTEMAEALIEIGDNSIMRHLEKNPAEAARIAKLPKSRQADAVFALFEQIAGPAEKPAKPKAESMDDYAKRRRPELYEARSATGMARGWGTVHPGDPYPVQGTLRTNIFSPGGNKDMPIPGRPRSDRR